MAYVLLLVGLAILVAGAELLVRGAVVLAERGRISPLVIGLTVVAFGTSAPELAVSAISSLNGESEIALGNVVGSNIFNILLILGLSAVIVPLTVSSQLVRLDVPLMIGASVLAWLAAYDGSIERWEGIGMLVSFLLYTVWLIRAGRKETPPPKVDGEPPRDAGWRGVIVNLLLLVAGLGLLVWGAQMLVGSATTIARQFGVSDLIIGLTIVAAGTSLPELATSLVAAIKGQRDIAVGNVVGSNVFNLLMVLSAASVFSASGVPVPAPVQWFDLTFMLGVALLCWPIFLSHGEVSRGEGAVMLVLYLIFTGLLIGESMQMQEIPLMKNLLVFAVMPIIVLSFSFLALRSERMYRSPQNKNADL